MQSILRPPPAGRVGSCDRRPQPLLSRTLALFLLCELCALRDLCVKSFDFAFSIFPSLRKTCHPDRSGPTFSLAPICGASGRVVEGSLLHSFTLSLFHSFTSSLPLRPLCLCVKLVFLFSVSSVFFSL